MDAGPPTDRSGRAAPELVKDMITGTQALVREEVQLAKLELQANLTAKAIGGGMFAVIGVLALYLVGFLGLAAGAGLKNVVSDWLAWLIVAGVFLLLMIVLALVGKKKLAGPTGPEQSIERIKEDVSWAKQTFKRN